jgi:hypothetical protein
MSNHDFHKSSLDDAIDEAVRDIMQVDPRPGLRRRVLSQLDAPAASRSWVPRVLVPFGVLATIVLAILFLDRESPIQPTDPAATAASAPAPTVSAPAVTAATTPTPPSAVAAPPSVSANARPRAPRAAAPIAAPSESIFGPRRDRVSAAGVKPEGALPPLVLPALNIQPLNLDALPGRIR